MIDLHVTPDEFGQIRDAIDQATRTAALIGDTEVNIRAIIVRVLGDAVAQSIGPRRARLVVHFDGAPIQSRIQEAM